MRLSWICGGCAESVRLIRPHTPQPWTQGSSSRRWTAASGSDGSCWATTRGRDLAQPWAGPSGRTASDTVAISAARWETRCSVSRRCSPTGPSCKHGPRHDRRRGLDLKRLFIGTEGTFGVVTAATLCVFPVPEREEIHGFSVRDFATGFRGIAWIYDSGLTPSVMDFEETFPAPTLPWRSEEGPPTLYLGFAGSREIVAASWRLARRHLRSVAARPLPDREAREYWKTRHDIIYAHDEVSPGVTRADLFLKDVLFDYVHAALPRSRVLSYRRAALAVLRRHGVKPIGFGVWTQPELVSLEVVRPAGQDRTASRIAVAAAVDDVIHRVHALGGSMEYVHGVGAKLAHLLDEELGLGLAMVRKVKRALDPAGTSNPGKAGL